MHEHYDQSLFCSGVKKHCLWWGEGLESALVVRLLGPGAGLGLWAAGDRTAPCLPKFRNFLDNILTQSRLWHLVKY